VTCDISGGIGLIIWPPQDDLQSLQSWECRLDRRYFVTQDPQATWSDERIGLALAESQTAAIRRALVSKVLVITGGVPASARPPFVKGILRILDAKGARLLLCAPCLRPI
jgi:hypothetical protein